MKKLVKSENIQYELLSKSLIDNCGVLTFDFVHEEEGGNNSQIIFNVSNIISLSPRKLVMTGSGMINRNKTKKIYPKKFYNNRFIVNRDITLQCTKL